MREQRDVVHVDQRLRHARLVGEDIETGGQDRLVAQRRDQRVFIDDRAARDIDEDAVGAERLEHFGIDDSVGRRAAGRDDHQNVDRLRHVGEVREIGIGDIGLPAAPVVGDFQAQRLAASGDRLADAPEAQNAHGAPAQRRGERKRLLQPFAGPDIAVGLREPPHGAEQQADGGVRHLLVQHVRRVRHGDAVRPGPFGVDMVIADAKARDDLELGELRHESGVDGLVPAARDNGADDRGDLIQPRRGIRRLPDFMHSESRVDALGDQGCHRGGHQDVDRFHLALPRTRCLGGPTKRLAARSLASYRLRLHHARVKNAD